MGTASSAGKVEYRSGFEKQLQERLDNTKVVFGYESETFRLNLSTTGYCCTKCNLCSTVVRRVRYTPDFFFRTGWIIEAKGKFTARDRKLAIAFTEQYPDRKYGILFQRDNWLTKKRARRYSEWAQSHGIPWAIGWFKNEWIK